MNQVDESDTMPDIDAMFHDAEREQTIGEARDLGRMFGAFHEALTASNVPESSKQQLTAMYGVHVFNTAAQSE